MTYSIQNRKVYFKDLQLISYKDAWDLQESKLKESVDVKLKAGKSEDFANSSPETINYLYFCEHPHVYTLGKSGKEGNLLLDKERISTIGAEYFPINRGGDITYHGPGQLVVYPILDLENFFTDIHRYMRHLEEIVIQTCADFGLISGRVPGLTGVWIDHESNNPRKICAMGVKTSRWVTMHGLALNINTNLSYFDHIVPCGITDKGVTSLEKELGHHVSIDEVKESIKKHFKTIFEAQLLEN